jgi:hypothetical protein
LLPVWRRRGEAAIDFVAASSSRWSCCSHSQASKLRRHCSSPPRPHRRSVFERSRCTWLRWPHRALPGREYRMVCGFRRMRTVIPIDCGQRFRSIADSVPVIADSGSRRRLQGLTRRCRCQALHANPPCQHQLSSHPLVRSAPSFRPDPHAPRAGARSGGQGWPVFGPPRQRRAASLTAASTTAGSIASGASRRTHLSWGRKRTHGHLPDFSGGLRRVSPSRARRCAVCTRRSRTASAIVGSTITSCQ